LSEVKIEEGHGREQKEITRERIQKDGKKEHTVRHWKPSEVGFHALAASASLVSTANP
jgi:hypothetical protein